MGLRLNKGSKVVKEDKVAMHFPIDTATKLLDRHRCLIEHWASTFLTSSFDKMAEHVRPFINSPHLQEEFYDVCNQCRYTRSTSHSVTPLKLKPHNDKMSPKKTGGEHLVPYLKHLAGNNIHTLVDVGAGSVPPHLPF